MYVVQWFLTITDTVGPEGVKYIEMFGTLKLNTIQLHDIVILR